MPKACAGAAVSSPATAPPRAAPAAVLVCSMTVVLRSMEDDAATNAAGAAMCSKAQAPSVSSKTAGNVDRAIAAIPTAALATAADWEAR
eukprot:CAMPEP_0115240012 /NCGR_PEP_ID=MMETSP0270-20121206/37694_1 /TAXON_ID=71861 /ORGANISM="Scrippsiella trochoidea, Strain CCMP3099" /LENGTH=88 /DNA_ID=CAMNT_0002654987 /DNA_START=27 /DNA_END=293 /DNA_ORIENTATION=-